MLQYRANTIQHVEYPWFQDGEVQTSFGLDHTILNTPHMAGVRLTKIGIKVLPCELAISESNLQEKQEGEVASSFLV